MHRRFTEDKIVVASHNLGKVREIRELLKPFSVETMSAGELNLDEPDETETTFRGNAILKAKAAAEASQLPALSDDSGLCVDAIGGDPGIFSARWAGPRKDFSIAMAKVHEALEALGDVQHDAHFTCALCLAWPDDHVEVFEGYVHGTIVWPPKGDKGFGYDPIFVPNGFDLTFGEMDPDQKHAMSHRADAFGQMIHACFKQPE